MSNITRNNHEAMLEKLWEVVHFYKEESLANQDAQDHDAIKALSEEHDDIDTVMAWLREDLGLPDEMEIEKAKEDNSKVGTNEYNLTANVMLAHKFQSTSLDSAIEEAITLPMQEWSTICEFDVVETTS